MDQPITYVFLETCESTMDEAQKLWKTDAHPPTCIVTRTQTRGRGRHARSWDSTSHDLIFTHLIAVPSEDQLRRVGIASMVAMCTTLHAEFGVEVRAKWPNDGYVAGKKLFGVLVEAGWGSRGFFEVSVGVGVNVDRRDAYASLRDATDKPVDARHVISAWWRRVAHYLVCPPGELSSALHALDMLLHQRVEVSARKTTGVVVGYTDGWQAVVELSTGERLVCDREELVLWK